MNGQFHSDAKLPFGHVTTFIQSHCYVIKLQPIMSLLCFHTFSLLVLSCIFGKISWDLKYSLPS